ncbi:MAG TPA: type II toxin-antitoxin system prevent-host-death family antitoxin [Micromonosporaceae bacterium]|nr:type II toxin-antitoxin system prevent-host-death family antitoxin [Micromonosporaceae bacterium]
MEQVAIRELNQNTSRVMARVRAGETVEVTDRGEPIARIVPITGAGSVLARLVAQGRAVAPTTTGPLPVPPVFGDPSVDVAAELASSREDERW